MPKVWFVGAGPGDPDLITVRGRGLIEKAGAILYAGSLVDRAVTQWAPEGCRIADSKGMTLGEIIEWLLEAAASCETVVRLQTGDPSLYGALVEMIAPLEEAGVEIGVVPGVSSAFASAAAAQVSLTAPEVTQSVIFTRVEGRTPSPERLSELAKEKCTICLFLSITLLPKARTELLTAGWSDADPALIVQKAGWSGQEKVIRTTIGQMEEDRATAGVDSQAMVIVGPTLKKTGQPAPPSRLYAAEFGHRFRAASEEEKERG